MKICIIGSEEGHVGKWINYLKLKGYNCLVINPAIEEIKCKIPKIKRIEKFIKFRKKIKKFAPDIIHINFPYPTIHNTYYYLGLKNIIIHLYGSDIVWENEVTEPMKIKLYKYFILKNARAIITLSDYLTNITKKYAPKNKKIYTIPIGVDFSLFKPQKSQRNGSIVLGCTKYFHKRYGHEYLIKAMKIVVEKFPNTKLLLFGKGAIENELKKLTVSLELSKNIEFKGEIDNKFMPKVLSQIDILVMPSLWESLGVSAIEAQAMEIPVVATKVGGIPEVVKDGVTGILVNPKDEKALAEAIIKLIEDEELRKKMGKEGRKYVIEKYEWNKNAAKIENIYKNAKLNTQNAKLQLKTKSFKF